MSRLFCALCFLVLACGQDGNDGPSSSTSPGAVTPGVVDPGAKSVSGSFFLGTTDVPAKGFEVWVIGHTAGGVYRYELGEDGVFSAPVSAFVEGNIYSLAIVDHFRLVGDIDLAPDVTGTQAAFTYAGGYGFDLGSIVLPLTNHGTVDPEAHPSGEIGGGFALQAASATSLATFPLPPYLQRFEAGSQLDIFEPETLLQAFYRKATNPALYASALNVSSKIQYVLEAKEDGGVKRVFALYAGSWLPSARLSGSEDMTLPAAPLWSQTKFDFTAASGTLFKASVFPGSFLEGVPLALIKVSPKSDEDAPTPQSVVPRMVSSMVSDPGAVTGIALNTGDTITPVDYTSETDANGVTRPFCPRGDVTLALRGPLDQDGAQVAFDLLGTVDVALDFYGVIDGKTTRLPATALDFPVAYQVPIADVPEGGMTRSWDPANLTIRQTYDATAWAAGLQVKIPSDMLIISVGPAGVYKIRARVYYRSVTGATEGAVAVWLAKGC